MDFPRYLMALITVMLICKDDKYALAAGPINVFSIIHDLLQYNFVGPPVAHEKTEWDFDPEVGKQRRVRYEQENGRYGEDAIAKVGMGVGFKGPWGTPALKKD